MGERPLGDDGTIRDLPWAAVFDPAANVHALGVVQAQGLRAAIDVVDRFVKPAAPGSTAHRSEEGSSGADPGAGPGDPAASSASTPTVDGVLCSWEALLDKLARVAAPQASVPNGSPTVDLNAATSTATMHVRTGTSGPAHTELWLHNGAGAAHGEVVLRCGDLLSHDGAVIAAGAVRFDPNPVPMPARSSRGTVVTVDLTDGVPPGTYRGTVLVDGHPDAWLPLVLEVHSDA